MTTRAIDTVAAVHGFPQPRPGAPALPPDGVAYVYSGFAKKLLSLAPNAVHAALLARRLRPYVLHDDSRCLYVGETPHHSEGLLRRFLEETSAGWPRRVAIGASGGGFGALKHGILHGFDLIVGFSAFTSFDEAMIARDDRGRAALDRLRAAEPVEARRNIRHFLETTNFAGRIVLFFGRGNRGDRIQARNLEDFPQVELAALPTDDHNLDADLEGVFDGYLDHALGRPGAA